MKMIPFGKNIRELRASRNWSQKQLAQRISVSASLIALYETGDRLPSLQNLMDIARTFGVSTDYLLGRDPMKQDVIDVSGLSPVEVQHLTAIADHYKELKGLSK